MSDCKPIGSTLDSPTEYIESLHVRIDELKDELNIARHAAAAEAKLADQFKAQLAAMTENRDECNELYMKEAEENMARNRKLNAALDREQKLLEVLQEIVKYCSPWMHHMWAKWITAIALGKEEWRD